MPGRPPPSSRPRPSRAARRGRGGSRRRRRPCTARASAEPVRGALVGAGLDDPGGVARRGRAAAPRARRRSAARAARCVARAAARRRRAAPPPRRRAARRAGAATARRVPSQLKPSRQAVRRDAQLPRFAHQITARSPRSSKPQSSSSPQGARHEPAAAGPRVRAVRDLRAAVALVAQLDRAAEARDAVVVEGLHRERPAPARPARRDRPRRRTGRRARGCRAPGRSSTAGSPGRCTARGPRSTSSGRWARRVTTPSVSTGTSSGNSPGRSGRVMGATLSSHAYGGKPLSL